jgi:tight adherence protein C
MTRSLLGAILGLGLYFGLATAWKGLSPKRTSLEDLLKAAGTPLVSSPLNRKEQVLETLAQDAIASGLLKSDLAVLNRSSAEFAAQRLVLMLLLGGAPVVLVLLTGATGSISWNPVTVLALSVFGTVSGWFAARLVISSQATERRRAFESELASYLDFVALHLAGGAGVDEALNLAAASGQAPGVILIRDAVNASITKGIPVWDSLGELAQRTRFNPLQELVSSVRLAGGRGAQVRTSLVAKADALRATEDSRELADAERSSEQMGVPVVLMFLIFIILSSAPLVSQVLAA